MSARYFADYVKDFRASGALRLETAVLVRHGDGELEAQREFVTATGKDSSMPSFPSLSFASEVEPLASVVSPQSKSSARASMATPQRDGEAFGLVFLLAKRPGNAFDHISIGRTASVDVELPLAQVSKFHAYFHRDSSGQFTIADAGSKNGTWIGARRLSVRAPEPVQDGDRIRLGPYFFSFFTPAGFILTVKRRLQERTR